MAKLNPEIIAFLEKQGFVIVSTIDHAGNIHNSCKGIVKIKEAEIYLLDLYLHQTFKNLKGNPCMSITAVNEHSFEGYCLKGRGRIVQVEALPAEIIQAWEAKISSRISQRIIKNIRGESGHPRHPEAALPKPQYMILMQVKEVIDLTPSHLK